MAELHITTSGTFPGDTVEVKLSIETFIGRDKAWTSYGVTSTVQKGESEEMARQRVTEAVTSGVLQVAQQAADEINKFEEKQRGSVQ